ncbi:MAG: Sulfate transport system permease protein CysW [Firmicutes bacterium]|nr:Sulfate transport system permease protein CysW [Bacillota bacterium]
MVVSPNPNQSKRPSRLLPLVLYATIALVVLPVVVVASSLLTPSTVVWRHLAQTILPMLLGNTALLLLGVSAGTLVIGTGLAWLITAFDFPGRRQFRWMLVLPMAIPAYVMGFIYMALFDFAGPFHTFVRSTWGQDAYFPQIRSGWGAILVMTLTLYPYVYLLAKAGFEEQAGSNFEAAKALGSGKLRAFFTIALPLARPSIAAGVALAAMESLADFATVRYFNFPTVADGILRVWHGMMDLGAASELAGLLALFSLFLLLIEHRNRGRMKYYQSRGKLPGIPVVRLGGWTAALATLCCALTLFAAFGLPLLQLLVWAVRELAILTPAVMATYWRLAVNSLTLASLAGGLVVLLALIVASLSRLSGRKTLQNLSRLVTIGYAIPGAVIAVGILLPLAFLDHSLNIMTSELWGFAPGLLFTGSLVGLMYAYIVRFMAIAYSSVDASMEKITPNTVLAARALGANARRVLFDVQLPLIMPGVLAGAVLVFVDVMKELPITVMMRPMGYDTLAVWVWQMAAESLWTSTALPALIIVLVGLVPIKILLEASSAGDKKHIG